MPYDLLIDVERLTIVVRGHGRGTTADTLRLIERRVNALVMRNIPKGEERAVPIEEARARSYRRLSLETGSGEAFEAALALYRRRGFVSGGAFGGYVASDFNQFMHLEL